MVPYLKSLICATIISAIVVNIFKKKTPIGHHIRLLVGIFLSITIISPLYKLEIPDFDIYKSSLDIEAQKIVGEGESLYEAQRRSIISQQLEAYILNKATELNADIRVAIKLSEEDIPTPVSVEIEGSVAPYDRFVLEKYIANEIGIPKERQMWN